MNDAELYAALERDLWLTDDIDDALFIDRDGRMRTDPSRKPPPGGIPAHLDALLQIPELENLDEPLQSALRAGMIRVRVIRTADLPEISLTVEVPLSALQRDSLQWLVDGVRPGKISGKFAGTRFSSIDVLPVE